MVYVLQATIRIGNCQLIFNVDTVIKEVFGRLCDNVGLKTKMAAKLK
jgi:hypothetical protein